MQSANDKQSLFFVEFKLILGAGVCERCIEPFFKRFDRVENLGQSEIEESPEFWQ
jgi:hypothetical protein